MVEVCVFILLLFYYYMVIIQTAVSSLTQTMADSSPIKAKKTVKL